jgi:hypothetical protein
MRQYFFGLEPLHGHTASSPVNSPPGGFMTPIQSSAADIFKANELLALAKAFADECEIISEIQDSGYEMPLGYFRRISHSSFE